MGGENFLSPTLLTEEGSSVGQISNESIESGFSRGEEGLSARLANGESGSHFEQFFDVGYRNYSSIEAADRQRRKVYAEVVRSYGEMQSRIGRLEEAKRKILSYTPGSFVENMGGMDLSAYSITKITSLLLIGPKGSGKSSLINKISAVLEDDMFAPERAQVSYNSSADEGTFFLQEYVIPRGSGSFCLFDTRSLSDDSSENMNILKHWMTNGVRHGELVKRESDSSYLKARLNCKARQSCPGEVRAINFVIFVVNGLSILESVSSEDETKKQYTQMLATTFSNPLLSFKDDKPAVVVTHGDLLPLSDRARIRVHLGELFGVPPKQIFDIPDSNDSHTTLTIFDMLHYCLEHGDRNLPPRYQYKSKIHTPSLAGRLLLFMVVLGIAIAIQAHHSKISRASSDIHVEWHKIRHIW